MERILEVIREDCVEVVESLVSRGWSRRFGFLSDRGILRVRCRVEDVNGSGRGKPTEGLS